MRIDLWKKKTNAKLVPYKENICYNECALLINKERIKCCFFENDYSEGAHPEVLKRLIETNMEQVPGYGMDPYCESAKEKIRTSCGCPEADVYFLVGGTQTNAVVIASILRRYEGVVAACTGHVSVHEAGAIEFTGHKVLTLPQREGKISAEDLAGFMETFYGDETHEHMVFPGMVYISHPTEVGTLYTKKELEEISAVCRRYELPLYVDGARLGYGLVSPLADVTMEDLARLADVFYIGGTKVGALCGEAVVFTQKAPAHFMTMVKQQGALLAKGRLLGVQFDALFTDNLYEKISRNAVDTAQKLQRALEEKGLRTIFKIPHQPDFRGDGKPPPGRAGGKVRYSFWEKRDENHTVVRFATSWATPMEDVEALIGML